MSPKHCDHRKNRQKTFIFGKYYLPPRRYAAMQAPQTRRAAPNDFISMGVPMLYRINDLELDHSAYSPAQQAIADSVMLLLERAEHALTRDKEEALRCIGRARSLARSWSGKGQPELEGLYRGGLAPWQVQRIKHFIEEHLSATIRISDLAKCISLSNSYFFQAFRLTFRQSPHAYVTACRIERAQKMMILTNQPLSQISLECGLADQPHLTRLFRRIVGTSPAVWRKSCRAVSADAA